MSKNKIVFALIIFFVSVSNCYSLSVRLVSLDEMIQESQFVFEGEVLTHNTESTNSRRFHTYVTFQVFEVIKGDYSDNTIKLRFLGGRIGNMRMAVNGMKIPKVGERGIYFVESLDEMQIHPLYGWSQGHFLVRPDKMGIDRIMTNAEQPVTEIEHDTTKTQDDSLPISKGIARGVVSKLQNVDQKGLTADEFKKKLREMLGE